MFFTLQPKGFEIEKLFRRFCSYVLPSNFPLISTRICYTNCIVAGMTRHILTTFICLVWLVNGLFCKVLNLVPRHQEIVARILGEQYSWLFTKAIGVSEMLMVVWVLSRIKTRFCAIFQMVIIGTMNIIEFILAPDLLLFGRMNIVVASIFIGLIYVNEFVIAKHKATNLVS